MDYDGYYDASVYPNETKDIQNLQETREAIELTASYQQTKPISLFFTMKIFVIFTKKNSMNRREF